MNETEENAVSVQRDVHLEIEGIRVEVETPRRDAERSVANDACRLVEPLPPADRVTIGCDGIHWQTRCSTFGVNAE